MLTCYNYDMLRKSTSGEELAERLKGKSLRPSPLFLSGFISFLPSFFCGFRRRRRKVKGDGAGDDGADLATKEEGLGTDGMDNVP